MNRTSEASANWHRKLDLSTKIYRRIGSIAIAVILGGGILWSSFAPIAGAVIAPGVIIVTGQNKTVQHLEGGIIERILVQEGQAVEQGQTIVRMSETAARSNLERVSAQYDALRAMEARYLAERDSSLAISFPADLLARKQEPAVAAILAGQEREFETRRQSLDSQISVLESQIAASSEQVTGLEAQREAAERQMALVNEELEDMRSLLAQGLAQKSRVLALDRAGAELLGNKGQFIAQIAQTRQAIAETKFRILSSRQAWMEKTISELRDLQIQLADLNERIKAARDIATRIEVRAPVAGTLVKLHQYTEGGVIGPGQPIADILPVGAFDIEARILPQDINRVHNGTETRMRFPALRERTTPTLHGFVSFISPDRLTDQRTGEAYFLARVKVAEDLAEDEKQAVTKLLPGMPVEVYVETGERTFFQYLLSPLSDVVGRAFREH